MAARCADSVFYNGKVLTFASERRSARAIAVEDGVIVAVGTDGEIRKSAPRGCAKYDLGGKIVVPGFIDCHTHFIQMGMDSLDVNLSETDTIDEALALMKAAAGKSPEGQWIIGTCWRESKWKNGRFITRADLDAACPKHPAAAHRICGHLSSVNSKAIEEIGITSKTPYVDLDPAGNMIGTVRESAVELVRNATEPDLARKMKGLALATRKAHSLGVTSVHDNSAEGDMKVFQAAERSGKLGVRVRVNVPSRNLDAMLRLRLSGNFGNDRLMIGGLKIFCDGALGARSAALSEPFTDDPGNKGMFVHDRKDLDQMVADSNDAGIQVAVHAIGDEGIEAALSSIEAALDRNPRKDHRHRIEHLELPTADHIARMRKRGIVASMQPNFVGEWGGINGMYVDRLGPERAKRNNPFAEVLKAKVRMVFGSDCMPFSPLYGIHSAVNAPYPSQRISVEDAIAAYTREAAFASFEEGLKGSIEDGKLGDFVVLVGDPYADPGNVVSVGVTKTIVGGEVVYDRAVSKKS
jgi:hypothetical protein